MTQQNDLKVSASRPTNSLGLSTTIAAITISLLTANPATALADDNVSPSTTSSPAISKCNFASKNPCVSTSNVRQIDLYSPPWTFSTSADDVMSRLKGAVVSDSNNEIIEQDGNSYLAVQARRPNDLFSTVDKLEFLINAKDQVVTFRSEAPTEGNDFGLQRRRLDEIRKRAGVFGVMGEGVNTADSVSTSERGNGPIGQLKAFYGLQSGSGFEDVLAE